MVVSEKPERLSRVVQNETHHGSIGVTSDKVIVRPQDADIDLRLANCQRALVRLLIGVVFYSTTRIALVTLVSAMGWEEPIYHVAISAAKMLTVLIAVSAVWRVQIRVIRISYVIACAITLAVQCLRFFELDTHLFLRPVFRGLDLAVILALAFTTYKLVTQITADKQAKEEGFLDTLALRSHGNVGDDFLSHLVNSLESLLSVQHACIVELRDGTEPRNVVVASSTGSLVPIDMQTSLDQDLFQKDSGDKELGDKDSIDKRSMEEFCRERELGLTTIPLSGHTPVDGTEQETLLGYIYLIHNSDFSMSTRQRATLRVLGGRAAAELERRRLDAINRTLELQMWQVQKLESLGIMAGGIAHDFNNILAAIRSYTSVLVENAVEDDDSFARLAGIQLAVDRGKRLCDSLLAYSGGSVTNKRLVDINPLLEQLAGVVHASCPEKRFELRLRKQPAFVWGDEGQLSQVFLNLMKNAQEATDVSDSGLTIQSGIKQAEPDMEQRGPSKPQLFVVVEVTDKGHGIHADILNQVFDPFFSTKGTGRGLGLSAVLGIVRQHGGDILVQSSPGVGTKFTVKLPLSADRSTNTNPGRNHRQTLTRLHEQKEILLVDDDELVRDSLSTQLIQLGLHPTVVSSGDEAIKEYQRYGDVFDMVIVDQTMPGLSGVDTIRRLRELGLKSKAILTSGYSQQGIGELPADLGFLRKPYTKDDLLEVLQR